MTLPFAVPNQDEDTSDSAFPPGLTLIENFVTKEQEEYLLRTLDWDECGTMHLLSYNNIIKINLNSMLKARNILQNLPLRN